MHPTQEFEQWGAQSEQGRTHLTTYRVFLSWMKWTSLAIGAILALMATFLV